MFFWFLFAQIDAFQTDQGKLFVNFIRLFEPLYLGDCLTD